MKKMHEIVKMCYYYAIFLEDDEMPINTENNAVDLPKDRGAVLKKIRDLREEIEKTALRNSELESEIASTRKEFGQFQDENVSLNDQVKRLDEETDKLSSCESEIAFLEIEKRDIEKKAEALQSEIQNYSSIIVTLNLRAKHSAKRKNDFQAKLQLQVKDNQSISDEILNCQSLFQARTDEITACKEKIETLREELGIVKGKENELGEIYQIIKGFLLLSRGQIDLNV
ncbi:MAG: hypothetical protein HQM09_04010 [Candidatus Riflebacteria bacterium]|nr:hypothetical protein [Candidatus Riflebacteria bacterium]